MRVDMLWKKWTPRNSFKHTVQEQCIMDLVKNEYHQKCNDPSDIHEHLPTLYKYARMCESVFETGVRGCVSSWALVYGLMNNGRSSRKIFLNDITSCPIQPLLSVTSKLDIVVEYEWINNLKLDLKQTFDMTFIDTWHVYGQLKRELAKFAPLTTKYILLHDTTVDEVYGETLRTGWNPYEQSIASGIPVDEITRGLWPAVQEFVAEHPEWVIKERFTNNNGLTVLERIRS